MTMSAMQPSSMRDSKGGANSVASAREGGGAAGRAGGGGLGGAASMLVSSASASSVRPTDSSQRGLSGSALRIYQTARAPMPPRTNMLRQPKAGIITVLTSTATGKPVTTTTARKPSQ